MKLNINQAQEIINKYLEGNSSNDLASEYNVSQSTIIQLIKGKTWKQCNRPKNIKSKMSGSKINQQQAQEIIDQYIGGKSSYELAEQYDIWQTTICNIIRGHSWKQCRRPENIKEIINSKHPGKGHKELPDLTELQMDVIIGSLLGDGSIRSINKRNNADFSKLQSLSKKEYIDWHSEIFHQHSAKIQAIYSKEKLTNKNKIIKRQPFKKQLAGYMFKTYRHPMFTKLRKQWYPDNLKTIPSNLTLNPRRIAIWYFDDGSNNEKQRYAVICTNSFSTDEVKFLCKKLHDFDLHPKIITRKSAYTNREMPMLKFSKNSYDNLISLVKPYMLWKCFDYKVKWHRSLKQWEVHGKFTEKQVLKILELRKTKSSKEIAKQFNVHVNTIYALVSGRSWSHLHR
ncbi:MAG: hypothetical protein DWQ19_12635 [Crenarchaeota archaeon]|nr:MAG: hypothetical protein DWQ19_12635 [Thermoproteota archaeon]